MEKKKSSINKNTWWDRFCLRCQLLWVWFLKNLSLMIKVGIIIVAILVATNVIGSEDFIVQILGFADLQQIDWASVKGIENAVAIVVSAIVTALLIVTKTKRLAIEDIKSRSLKIALIKAKLYFNEEGKLCKRAEELVDLDLNEDDKIGNTNIEDVPNENIITGMARAVDELKTVLTTDLHDSDTVIEDDELHEEIKEEKVEETEIGLNDDNGADVGISESTEQPEDVVETKPEAKAKKKCIKMPNIFVKSWTKLCLMFNNVKFSLKAMKDPKLDDGMEKKKKEKAPKIKKEKKIKENKNKVEFITEAEDTSDLLDSDKTIENKNIVVEEQPKVETKQIAKQSERIDNKAQQINNILNNLK